MVSEGYIYILVCIDGRHIYCDSILIDSTYVCHQYKYVAQWLEHLPCDYKVMGSEHNSLRTCI